jgi:hypothetical protein
MRRWGVIVTAVYGLVVIFLLVPGAVAISGGDYFEVLDDLFGTEGFFTSDALIGWLIIAAVIAAQAILFIVSVDTSFRRLKPRMHVALSIGTVALSVGLLCFAVGVCIAAAVVGDDLISEAWFWIGAPISLWLVWSVIFYLYRQQFSQKLDRVIGWLLNGSVLQLLIAIPCHLIVRHRNDCSAPAVTGFGIATGVALMLMAFGPGVVFLYQKRLGEYERKRRSAPLLARWPVQTLLTTIFLGSITLFLLLPYDGSASHIGSIDDVSGMPDEVVAAIEAHANRLGMHVRETRDWFWIIECGDNVVANFRATEDSDSAVISWSYLTFSEPFLFWDDYMRFAESIDKLLTQFGDPTGIYVDRPSLPDRLRGQLFEGTLLGGGCTPNPIA